MNVELTMFDTDGMGHSIAAIHNQIKQHLVEQHTVTNDGRQLWREVCVHDYVTTCQIAAHEFQNFLHHLIHIERLVLHFILSEQQAQTENDFTGAFIICDYVLKDISHFIQSGGILR
jgi:hypothetical protein